MLSYFGLCLVIVFPIMVVKDVLAARPKRKAKLAEKLREEQEKEQARIRNFFQGNVTDAQ